MRICTTFIVNSKHSMKHIRRAAIQIIHIVLSPSELFVNGNEFSARRGRHSTKSYPNKTSTEPNKRAQIHLIHSLGVLSELIPAMQILCEPQRTRTETNEDENTENKKRTEHKTANKNKNSQQQQQKDKNWVHQHGT